MRYQKSANIIIKQVSNHPNSKPIVSGIFCYQSNPFMPHPIQTRSKTTLFPISPKSKTPTISSPPRTQRSQFNTATVSNSKPNSSPYQNQQSQIPPSLSYPPQNHLCIMIILFYYYFCNNVS